MKQEIVQLIINVAEDMNETLENKIPAEKGTDTPSSALCERPSKH